MAAFAQRPVGAVIQDIVIGAGGLEFDSQPNQIGRGCVKWFARCTCDVHFLLQGFFRRMQIRAARNVPRCQKDNDCVITKDSRNRCQACRYRKCLVVGMHNKSK